ncbi:MAG: hypothetical protein CBB71_14900 [Rhodopirellula sp. TMED11]|nr:MAG: hypothetical protein CBB71_14900 [Rhodopirellula sp. TMED11]
MHFPKFWALATAHSDSATGERVTVKAYGWSDLSKDEAQQRAQQRATQAAKRRSDQSDVSERSQYDEYAATPLREPAVERVFAEGNEVAVISRNRYGALVLNCPSTMFVDIDFPAVAADGFLDHLKMMFSAGHRAKRIAQVEEQTLDRVRDWFAHHPEASGRLYRTHSGLRVLLCHREFDPDSPAAMTVLEELCSDPLYRSLTRRQSCFRARLTPKPWRCGCDQPPSRYPFLKESDQDRHQEWESKYLRASERFATCRLIETVGPATQAEPFQTIVQYHDSLACESEQPLA